MKTIFAKIMKNRNPESKAIVLHFFGERNEARWWADQYVGNREGGHGVNPYSFLAMNGFKCVNDNFFVKKYFFSKDKK